MRWKLLRRRLSVSAPRMIVRSHLPWPLRWALVGLVLGFSAAVAMWAFEFGKNIAGLDGDAKAELAKLRLELVQLKAERERTMSIANTAESLLRTEKVEQERIAQKVKQIEAENLELKGDLGFFQRLLPSRASEGVTIRALQAETKAPGQVRFQLLVMQAGNPTQAFDGRYDLTLSGTLDGKPWSFTPPGGPRALQMKQYLRLEGLIDHPLQAVVKSVQVRVMDTSGAVKAVQSARL
jgi:hypothetical protein